MFFVGDQSAYTRNGEGRRVVDWFFTVDVAQVTQTEKYLFNFCTMSTVFYKIGEDLFKLDNVDIQSCRQPNSSPCFKKGTRWKESR